MVLFKNPTNLRASRSKRASLVGSPPVPDRFCSLSPVKICKQRMDKNPARTVKPAWPPCWASSLMATRQDCMKDCNWGWSLQRSRNKEPWVTKMHRLGESALKEAWRSSGVMSSLELTLTWLARIRPYWARTSSEASWRSRSMFSIAVARGRLGSAERRVLTSRMVERTISRREALKVFPAPKIPWTQRVVCPERRP